MNTSASAVMIKARVFKIRAFLLGVLSVVAQVILFRVLMSALYGNELVWAGVMAAWACATAAGSWVAGRLRLKLGFMGFFVGWSAAFVGSLWMAGHGRAILGWPFGQLPDIGSALLAAGIVSFPVSFVGGLWFGSMAAEDPDGSAAQLYAMDALGFAAGGFLTWVVFSFFSPVMDRLALPASGKEFHVLESRQSLYGALTVLERQGERSFFENGLLSGTSGDRLSAEEAVHYALLAHPSPQRLLLIGGAVSGAIGEALKHPGLRVDYVAHDALGLELIRRHFPEALRSLTDPRVTVIAEDVRRAVRRNRGLYDVVILASSSPLSFLANRQYTREFFDDVRRILSSSGVFSLQAPASENYVNREGRAFLSSVRATLAGTFSDVVIIPGGQYVFLAASQHGNISAREQELSSRIAARGLSLQFVRPYYFKSRLEPSRMKDALNTVSAPAAINTDERPSLMLSSLVYWSTRLGSGFADAARCVAGWSWILWGIPVLMGSAGAVVPVSPAAVSRIGMFMAGFTQIALQLCLVVLFQAVYGHVYSAIGLLTGFFMVGVFVSASGSSRGMLGNPGSAFRSVQVKAALVSGCAAAGMGLASVQPVAAWPLFGLMPFCVGWIGGEQFKTAGHLHNGRRGSSLYAWDMAGAAFGVMIVGIFLIPLWGLTTVALWCVLLSVSVPGVVRMVQPASVSSGR